MDHLPKVLNTQIPQSEVPYLKYDRFEYDGLAHSSFPNRKKFDIAASGPNEQWIRSCFLQSWLFFGTLIELFKIYDLPVETADFIHTSEDGRTVVTTEKLQAYLALWVLRELEQNKYCLRLPDELFGHGKYFDLMRPGVESRYQRILRILRTVCNTLLDLEKSSTKIIRSIWDSIIILGATLQTTAKTIFRCYKLDLESVRFDRVSFKTVSTRFESGRWCPAQQKLITELLSANPCNLFFCSQIDRAPDAQLHIECSAHHCTAFQVDEKTYHTQHVLGCNDSECPFLGSDDNAVVSHLTQKSLLSRKMGFTTVFQYTERGLVATQLNLGSSQPFVAISHVWADGLGNNISNKLPKCQITRIQDLVNNLFDSKYRPVPFWIDTLCIPLDKKARNLAIGKMQWVYATAKRVLVLDKSLERVRSTGMMPEEILAHIMCSNWCRRLWTLQEGGNQENVYWSFADAVETYSGLKAKIEERASIPNSLALLGDKLSQLHDPGKQNLTGFPLDNYGSEATNILWPQFLDFFQGIKTSSTTGISVPHTAYLSCIRAISIRDCSRPGDESLCLSTIISNQKFPPSLLINTPAAERYKTLFCSESMHPIGILFLDQKRYEEYGFRWIPKTLLQRHSPSRDIVRHSQDPFLGGSHHGLYGGILLKWRHKSEGLAVDLPGFDLPENTVLPTSPFQLHLHRGDDFRPVYRAVIHEAGELGPLANPPTGRLALLTPFAIWHVPSTCTCALVTVLNRPQSRGDYTNTRFEGLVDLVLMTGTPADEIPVAVTAAFDESLMYYRSQKMGPEFFARQWRVG